MHTKHWYGHARTYVEMLQVGFGRKACGIRSEIAVITRLIFLVESVCEISSSSSTKSISEPQSNLAKTELKLHVPRA